MVDKGLTAVGNCLQSFVILEESCKVEVFERQKLDVVRVLIDQEVTVLAQDSNRVLVCKLGNDLRSSKHVSLTEQARTCML